MQEEFRYGKLTKDTHCFLHGKPTLVPGSTLKGHAKCKNDWCKKRAIQMLELEKNGGLKEQFRAEYTEEIMKGECKECKKERNARILVASGPHDKRFMEA